MSPRRRAPRPATDEPAVAAAGGVDEGAAKAVAQGEQGAAAAAGRRRKPGSGRRYAGRSAAERQAEQRQRFLAAGRVLFADSGFRATSVRALCREAGLIDRYFYRNFADTQALLAALYTAEMDTVEARILAVFNAAEAGAPQQRIEPAMDTFFAAFEDRRFARICWLEVLGVGPDIDALYLERQNRFARLLETVGRQLRPEWPLDAQETQITTLALVGAISQSALHWYLTDYAAPRAVLVRTNLRLIRGALAALQE